LGIFQSTFKTTMAPAATPKATLKKSNSGSQSGKSQQRSILGFFGKKSATPASETSTPKQEAKSASQLTPAPSSDAAVPSSPIKVEVSNSKNKENGLPSPASPLSSGRSADGAVEGFGGNGVNSPSRKVGAFTIILLFDDLADFYL
jgi:DNA mismatch repair protein MSH6